MRRAAREPAPCPNTVIRPAVGVTVPAMQRRIVVFPDPFGPHSASRSPRASDTSRSCTTSRRPKLRPRPWTRSAPSSEEDDGVDDAVTRCEAASGLGERNKPVGSRAGSDDARFTSLTYPSGQTSASHARRFARDSLPYDICSTQRRIQGALRGILIGGWTGYSRGPCTFCVRCGGRTSDAPRPTRPAGALD